MEGNYFDILFESKSKTFFTFCFCFLTGIALASLKKWGIDLRWLIIVAFFLCVFLIKFLHSVSRRFFILCILFVLLGMIRCQMSFPDSSLLTQYQGKETMINGRITKEPDVREDGVRYALLAINLELKGKVYLKTHLYPRYQYGDRVLVWCELTLPEPIVDDKGKIFRYDMYLAKERIFLLCSRPSVVRVYPLIKQSFFSRIFFLKSIIAQKINQLWHEPFAGFMAGILYGYKGGLGKLSNDFQKTGLSHIVAVSGYNVSIIISFVISACRYLGLWRKKAMILTCFCIVLFVVFTGASSSVIRAGIMAGFVLFAKQIGRKSQMTNILIFSAVVMTALNPLVLVWDPGFQLSFLSTIGLIYFAPWLSEKLSNILEWNSIAEMISITLSAIFFTLPIVLYHFGQLSLVAVFTNILVLWIIPFIMFIGFASLALSFFSYPLGQALSDVAWLEMKYVVLIVQWFASLPIAVIKVPMSKYLVFVVYILFGYSIKKINKDK